jgi:Tfp pilus assembly protein PilF
LNDYNKAIEINPQNANAYYFRGVLMMEKGDNDKAFDDFNKAIQIKPDFFAALINSGTIWNKKGEWDKAIENYTKALSIKPDYEKAYISRGDVWLEKFEFDKAINDYSKAIAINSKNYKAYFWRQEASVRKGDYLNAIKDLENVIRINPKFAPAYNNYAWILATCREDKYRDGKKALELVKKASEIEPQYYYWGTLAAAYAEIGNYEEAVKAEKVAIKMIEETGERNLISGAKERLNRYLSNKPWRE